MRISDRISVRVVALVLAIVFPPSGSAAIAEEAFRPTLPEPSGADSVGTTVLELADPERRNGHPSEETRPREVSVQVWYPAQTQGSAEPVSYLLETDLLGAMESEEYLNISPALLKAWDGLLTHAERDAAVAGSSRRPVSPLSGSLRQT